MFLLDFKLKVYEKVNNKEVVALFGYLIKCNNQVHSFQEKVIDFYIQESGVGDTTITKSIVYDFEDAIPFERAIQAFAAENENVKKELYKFLIIVANIDGSIDSAEIDFFKNLKQFLPGIVVEDIEAKAIKKALAIRKKLKKENAKGRTGRRANANDNLFRIPQKEYVEAIDRCRKIANADYREVLPVCQCIIEKGINFLNIVDIELERFDVDFKPEIKQGIKKFATEFEKNIVEKADEYNAQLNRKATTLEDFTIALIGETKAGKTTLRSVLTGEGYDGIGAGKQRTTRVNHVYEWNNIRIIDTPGISAGSDFENKDKEIAKKAITESDLICYVTVTDGKFGETKEFITDILKSNKPVHILINYKNNLFDEFNYEDFINDPTEWCRQDGKNAISGYFEPIKRIAVQNNVESLLSCSYVFLLAAWLSENENYEKDSKILMGNSGLEEFLAKIKIVVTEQGSFLRSKTIIDDTIAICESWRETIAKRLKPVTTLKNDLQSNRKGTEAQLKKAQDRFSETVKTEVRSAYEWLAEEGTVEFLDKNFGCDKKELSSRWKTYCEEIKFAERLTNKLRRAYNEYSDKAKDILSDVLDDVQFDVKIAVKEITVKQKLDVPLKEVTGILGSVLALAGTIAMIVANTNPVGWILTSVGGILTAVSSLFKSKKDRQEKIKKNLYNKFNESVMKDYNKNKDQIQKDLNKSAQDLYDKVMSVYDETHQGITGVENAVKVVINEIDNNIQKLNYLFAERIIGYISNSSDFSVQCVERDFGKNIKIELKRDIECDTDKLVGLINETVEISKRSK